jgi:hypothetical protein
LEMVNGLDEMWSMDGLMGWLKVGPVWAHRVTGYRAPDDPGDVAGEIHRVGYTTTRFFSGWDHKGSSDVSKGQNSFLFDWSKSLQQPHPWDSEGNTNYKQITPMKY